MIVMIPTTIELALDSNHIKSGKLETYPIFILKKRKRSDDSDDSDND